MKDGFLLTDSKLEVSQDTWKSVALVAFKKVWKSIISMMQGYYESHVIVINNPIYK